MVAARETGLARHLDLSRPDGLPADLTRPVAAEAKTADTKTVALEAEPVPRAYKAQADEQTFRAVTNIDVEPLQIKAVLDNPNGRITAEKEPNHMDMRYFDAPEDVKMVMPGDNVAMEVELLTPVALEEQMRFAIREGGKTVGAGLVSEIIA